MLVIISYLLCFRGVNNKFDLPACCPFTYIFLTSLISHSVDDYDGILGPEMFHYHRWM